MITSFGFMARAESCQENLVNDLMQRCSNGLGLTGCQLLRLKPCWSSILRFPKLMTNLFVLIKKRLLAVNLTSQEASVRVSFATLFNLLSYALSLCYWLFYEFRLVQPAFYHFEISLQRWKRKRYFWPEKHPHSINCSGLTCQYPPLLYFYSCKD